MRHCEASLQWLPEAGSSLSHIGARWLYDWRQKNYWRSGLLPLAIYLLLYVALSALNEFPPLWYEAEWAPMIYIFGLLGLATIVLPLLVYSVFISRKKWISRLFVPELWILLFVITDIVVSESRDPIALMLPLGLATMMLAFRLIEAILQARSLKNIPWSDVAQWVNSLESWEMKRQIFFGLVGLVCLSGAVFTDYLLSESFKMTSAYLLGMLPFCIPWGSWLVTRLAARSSEEGWLVNDFRFFKNFRKCRLGILHSTGVLTEGDLKVKSVWIDEGAEWTADDIKEILVQMSNSQSHPFAQAISQHFSKRKKYLFEIEEIEIVPHMGVRATFLDVQRSRVQAILGQVGWHRALQSEMTDEGRVQLKKWMDQGLRVSLLAINHSVVAAIGCEDYWREDSSAAVAAMKGQQLAMVSLSSSNLEPPESIKLDESQWDLFPSERRLQYKIWTERISNAFELKAAWDTVAAIDLPTIVIRAHESSPSDHERIAILSPRLSSLASLFRASKSFFRTFWTLGFLTLAAGGLALASPTAAAGAASIFLFAIGALLWTSRFAVK